jgi:hypothetical protein
MGQHVMIDCSSLRYTACRARALHRRDRRVGARLAAYALALALLALMLYGQRWQLEESSSGLEEFVVANCVVDAVYGEPAQACTRIQNDIQEGSAL